MRALGPGSVSSILKVILDVSYYAMWVVAVLFAVGAAFALVQVFAPAALPPPSGGSARVILTHPASSAFGLATGALGTLGGIVIVGRLRALFAALTAGDPFHPDNVSHLRIIALVLAALQVGAYAGAAIRALFHLEPGRGETFNLIPWIAVLVILVLAEVFREGARLRREAELTI